MLAHIPAVLGYAISSQRHLCNELTIFCPRHFAFEIARREVRHELHGISASKNRKVKIALISKLGSSQYCVKQLQNCKRKVSTFDHDARLKKIVNCNLGGVRVKRECIAASISFLHT